MHSAPNSSSPSSGTSSHPVRPPPPSPRTTPATTRSAGDAGPRRLAQAQVMPGAQGAGEQRRQGGGDPGLAQRQRRGKAALAAEQAERPEPVPERVKLGPHGAGQPYAAARRPALHAVDVGQQPGELV